MSANKHTPGPWVAKQPEKVLGCNTHGQHYVHAKDCTIACTLGGEQSANARLIAAAPELLEALMDIARYVETRNYFAVETALSCLGHAHAAIVKATGNAT